MGLAGKFALVTGASSGIGAATARLLVQRGARVALTGRNEAALSSLVSQLRAEHPASSVDYFVGDVTQDADVSRVVAESVARLSADGRCNILVNCAGVLQGGAAGEAPMANWDANFAVNARGAYCFMLAATPFMERVATEADAGAEIEVETHQAKKASDRVPTNSIVNVSSVNGLQSFGGVSAYCASKAALDMLTDCAAVDLAPKGVRCNAVNPGVTVTELQKRGGLSDEAYAAFLARSKAVTHPLGRVADADEVAEAIVFLADSSKSDFITGTHLVVDGGRRCLGAR